MSLSELYSWFGTLPILTQLIFIFAYLILQGLFTWVFWYSGAGTNIIVGVGSAFVWVFKKLGLKQKPHHKTRVLEKVKY